MQTSEGGGWLWPGDRAVKIKFRPKMTGVAARVRIVTGDQGALRRVTPRKDVIQ